MDNTCENNYFVIISETRVVFALEIVIKMKIFLNINLRMQNVKSYVRLKFKM
jgi:hypothetical protein